MNTFSQGTEDWKQITKDMTIRAYSPVQPIAGTVCVVPPGLPMDDTESEWPYVRTTTSRQSSRLMRSLVTGRVPACV